jgi:hypothetical protein
MVATVEANHLHTMKHINKEFNKLAQLAQMLAFGCP